MLDSDTQKAINETLRNVRSRIQDQHEKMRRRRDGDATDSPLLSERMHAYSHAMRILGRFIDPVTETNELDA
jgi:soluble cytochrome b562